MFFATITNTKDFMTFLLKKDMFNNFELRELTATTFITYNIEGKLNKDFFEEETKPNNSFVFWEDVKPFVFHIIKGSKLPKHIKIIFCANQEMIEEISPEASALFINITFDGKNISFTTGASAKTFSLNKNHEILWDQWVKNFFGEHGIILEEPEYE